jgi:uncharacterized membrane protein
MSPLTLYLARLFGVFGVLMCLALVARPKSSIATIQSMTNSPGLILVTGICTMAAGAAIVIGHNVWSGGALAIVVTALGWVTLIKGFALMALPASALNRLYRAMHYPRRLRLVMAIALVLSAWLTWAAFTAAPAPGA